MSSVNAYDRWYNRLTPGDHSPSLLRHESTYSSRQLSDIRGMSADAVAFGAGANAKDPYAATIARPVFDPGGGFLGAPALPGPVARLTAEQASEIWAELKKPCAGSTKGCG